MVALTARRATNAAYKNAGLPHAAVVVDVDTTTRDRHSYDKEVGLLAHRLLADLVQPAQHAPQDQWAALVDDAVNGLVWAGRFGRPDKLRQRVAGLVANYLTMWLPPVGVTFVGAEVTVTKGRVDLAWAHPEVGVWYDEIKTWRNGTSTAAMETVRAQLDRYLTAGSNTYGNQFAGVRLLTLGYTNACLHVTPTGATQLSRSPLGPDALTHVTHPFGEAV